MGHYDEKVDEDGVLTHEGPATPTHLAILNEGEINQQIATARRFGRSPTTFRKQIMDLVALDTKVADSCIYALPRAGKTIEGPSVRFAEIMLSCWGNARAMARVVHEDDENIHAQGMFFDLEKNIAVTYEVMRRITNKAGKKYDRDMITVTGNAACAIAYRNAVLKGIPKAFWGDAFDKARAVVAGDVTTLANKRAEAIKAFAIFGVTPAQIFGLLGVNGAEDMTTEHVVQLKGLHVAIKDGDTSPEAAFAPENWKKPAAEGGGTAAATGRPTKDDFKDGKKPEGGKKADAKKAADEKKPDAKPTEGKPAEVAKTADPKPADAKAPDPKPAAEKKADPAPDLLAGAEANKKPDPSQAYKDYLADQYKALAAVKSITKLDDLQEQVERDLQGEPEDLKAFVDACNAKARELQKKK